MNEQTVQEWATAKLKLAELKETELELRKEICDHILGDKIKGSKKGVIGSFTLSASAKLNQTIDKELLKSIWPDLSIEEKKCIKFDPKIVAKEYKTVDAKSNLHQAITSKPGTPTLEIKGVKEK